MVATIVLAEDTRDMDQNQVRHLIAAVRNGDREAFRPLLVEYQARLRLLLRAILYDHTQVDDVAQETFVTAYLRLDTYDDTRAEFYVWLKGIARHLAANANRKSRTRQPVMARGRLDAAGAVAQVDRPPLGRAHV